MSGTSRMQRPPPAGAGPSGALREWTGYRRSLPAAAMRDGRSQGDRSGARSPPRAKRRSRYWAGGTSDGVGSASGAAETG